MFILTEANGSLSRDPVVVTAPAATKLEPGQVLGQLSADEKYVPYDETATDGRETAVGILYAEIDNSAGEAAADFPAVIINQDAEVVVAALQWGDADDDAGTADLRALGIKVR